MIGNKTLRAFIITLMLCALCTVGLASCGGNASGSKSDSSTSSQTQTAQTSETNDGSIATEDQGASNAAGTTLLPQSSGTSQGSGSSGPSEAAVDPDPEPEPAPEHVSFGVSITVDASAAGQGTFVSTYVTLWEGATVYDALCATGLAFGGDSNYVRSINGLSEFDHGRSSGWMYSVNGTTPMTPCGSYVLSNGDNVYWYYVV